MERIEDGWVSVSATTREPRPAEEHGVHYFFLTEQEFDEILAEDGFLEWAVVHDHRYGTLRSKVEEAMAAGKQVILEIDVQGAMQVRKKMPDAHLVFIKPPSLEVLEQRLRGRGTEEEDVIIKRMKTAKLELSYEKEYDICFVNDNLEVATNELVALVDSFAEEGE